MNQLDVKRVYTHKQQRPNAIMTIPGYAYYVQFEARFTRFVSSISPLLWLRASRTLRRTAERMRLRVEDPFVEANDIRSGVEHVIVLECLGDPETFHGVVHGRLLEHDVGDGRVGEIRVGGCHGSFKHGPALVHPCRVSGDAVHVPHRFDGFRAAGG